MSKLGLRLTMLAAGLAAWFFLTAAVNAQQSQPTPSDDEVNQVAKQLYCPVCENIPLDVCPTTACQDWREEIRQKLALGWDAQQIKDYFALQYGDRVLAEPPRRGLNWLVYVLPPVFFLVGVLVVARVLRRMKVRPAVAAPPPVEPGSEVSTDEYLKRVEEELKRAEHS